MSGRAAAPCLSVYSALYNRREGLEESISSVLDQTDVDLEFIVVDDGSTDGTYEYLMTIDDPRLVVARNDENIGFTRSIIRALSMARGRYAAAQDGGDVSLPGRFRAQIDFLDAHPDVVVVGVGVVNHHVAIGRRRHYSGRVRDGTREIIRYTHGEVMFRKEIYDAVGGYRDVFYYTQDKDLWHRMREHGRMELIDEVYYERRIFADSIQGDIFKLGQQAIFSNLVEHTRAARERSGVDPVQKLHTLAVLTQKATPAFTARMRHTVWRCLRSRRFADAREVLEGTPAGMLSPLLLGWLLALRLVTRRRAR